MSPIELRPVRPRADDDAPEHRERLLPRMLELARAGEADLVVGSRHVEGGGVGRWPLARRVVSRVAGLMAQLLVGGRLCDPMSGFFLVRKDAFEAAAPRLSGRGFKILLDVMVSAPVPLRIVELPYVFGLRMRGRSKLSAAVVFDYLAFLGRQTCARLAASRPAAFALVGASGLAALIATHNLELAARMDRRVTLQEGLVVQAA